MKTALTDYRTEARVLAVHPRVSWQGCHDRFEELRYTAETRK
nr:zeta toxin family protein [Phyllobacterium phragmitis]